jgi:CDP-paratose 2-epimerase
MKILITGGAGFVGSNLAILLKNKYPNYSIVCLDNLKRRGSELNLPRLFENNIQFIHGDIRQKEDLDSVNGFDVLIDASAEPSVLAGITSPIEQLVNNNFIGTVNCLECAKKNNAGFVFLSTSRVYPIKELESLDYVEQETRFEWLDFQKNKGASSKGITEDFNLNGSRSFYGATKLAAELMIQEYHALCNMDTVINRFGVITGPWQMGKIDQGVVVLWLANHYWKKKLSYIGYGGLGKQVRDILHIEDVFKLIDYQIHNIKNISGKTFNAGGGKDCSVSLLELTHICENITGNKIDINSIEENRSADLRIYVTDNTLVNKTTLWKPEKKPYETLSDIFEWLKTNEVILKPILNQ